MPYYRKTDAGLELFIRVTPRARNFKCLGVLNNRIRISVTQAPENGRATRGVVDYLAKTLKIPKSKIVVKAGDLSREKTLLLLDIDCALVLKTLDELLA